MNMAYDEEVDVLTITLSDAQIADSEEVRPGVILDYDQSGGTVSIELLDASRHVTNLYSLTYDHVKATPLERTPREAATELVA